MESTRKYGAIIIVLVAFFSIFIRWLNITEGFPYYSIDENDVVEGALSYLAGDIEPYWFKYGPLSAYMLAVVYGVMQSLGLLYANWSEFYYAAFFDSSYFYLIARIFHSFITLAICATVIRFSFKHYGKNAAWIALAICSAPIFEVLTDFTIRVDTVQGLWALLALLFSTGFDDPDKKTQNYVLAGVFLALSVAAKPMQGMLIIPALLYAHFSVVGVKQTPLFLGYLALSALIVHFLVHPYSLINFSAYFSEQITVFTDKSLQGGVIPGWDFRWVAERFGWLFSLGVLLGLLKALGAKDRATRVLLIYIISFCGVYVFFDVREYWYASVLPAVLVLLTRLFNDVFDGLTQYQPKYVPHLFVIPVIFVLVFLLSLNDRPRDSMRAALAAEQWVKINIPEGAPILTMGWYAINLPRLVDVDPERHAQWAEHFMYGRTNNKPWVKAYVLAHSQYMGAKKQGYRLVNVRKTYGDYPSYEDEAINGVSLPDINQKRMPEFARSLGAKYVITAGSLGFSGEWESSARVTFLARFEDSGNEVKIFQLN